MRRPISCRTSSFGRRLACDERGAVLVYASLALTVFMGFAALVIDGGRLFTLNTEQQGAADSLALAAAAELDGTTGAIARANSAMQTLVENSETFASGDIAFADVTATYLKKIPNDSEALPAVTDTSFVTTDDALARYVQVKVNQRDMGTIFAPAVGGERTAGSNAVAIAGQSQAVCKFTPLFICNPYASKETLLTKLANWTATNNADRRKLINLKKWSGNGQLSPGNFGFLDTPGQNGASALRHSLAIDQPLVCFSQNGVDLHQGNVASVRQAINTRFDLYEGNFQNSKNDEAYRPAMNVVKGYSVQNGNACNKTKNTLDTTNAMALPLDQTWTTLPGTTGARLGAGDWNCAAYWAWNHGPNHTATGDPTPPTGCSDATNTTTSRYDVYRYEITHRTSTPPGIPNLSNLNPKGENGNPQCNSAGLTDPSIDPDEIDRRILYGAVLDCSALPNGNSKKTMPALAFIKMFITRPMSKNSNDCNGNGNFDATCEEDASDLFIEIVDMVKPGNDDAVLHDLVQLYR